jgi:DNA modification methylase
MILPVQTKPCYSTEFGAAYCDDSLVLIDQIPDESISLIMTSPPFALLRKKEYGNEEQGDYVEWLAEFARRALPKLKQDGSLVIDIGGAYQRGVPVRALYPFKVAIHFVEVLGYHLAEDFYWFNSSKLPSPIEWVNKRKIRAKDSVNNVWWFSKTQYPKADITKVLAPYSDRMKKLIEDPDKFYTPKIRPSGHDIGKSFGKDNGGAIPSNLLQIPNSESNSQYSSFCRELDLKTHPARFPSKLPQFFINMLTDEGDVVLDIFAGSNTTGEIAERMGRRWLAFDLSREYLAASVFRFVPRELSIDAARNLHKRIIGGESVSIEQHALF